MKLAGTTTIDEARSQLDLNLEEGTECPVCDQYAKIYRRKLNSSMARGLIVLFHKWLSIDIDDWMHIPTIFVSTKVCASNDGALLRHWQLIEGAQGIRHDGSDRIGNYRLTEMGAAFALGECTVSKYAVIYNSNLLQLDGPQITILDALGSKFNYNELMSST